MIIRYGESTRRWNYSICGLEHLFAIERKSISDLISCCVGENRKRFERELHRLRGFRFKRLVVVGTESEILKGEYRSSIKPQAILGTLRAFEIRYDIPVMFCVSPELAGRQVESWVFWFAREMVKIVNALWRGSARPGNTGQPLGVEALQAQLPRTAYPWNRPCGRG